MLFSHEWKNENLLKWPPIKILQNIKEKNWLEVLALEEKNAIVFHIWTKLIFLTT